MVSDTKAYMFAEILRNSVSLIMLPIYTRYLTPEDYGVVELLSSNRRLEHQAAFCHSKDKHTRVIAGCSCRRVILAATGTCRAAGGRGLGTGTGCNGYYICICAELKVSTGKFIKGTLVLEKNDLAESLSAQLKADAALGYGCVSNICTLFIDMSIAIGAADNESSFSDGGKYSIAITLIEELIAFSSIFKNVV